ncbi:MAG: flagellar hook-associated protein FlgL [Gammaproteobacteria bacterium]
MRVSTADLYRTGVANMLDKQADTLRTQTQLSTGKRFSTAAEDPLGAAAAQRINTRLQELSAQDANISHARGNLSLEEEALNSVTNILNQAREIAVSSNNAVYDEVSLNQRADLIRQSIDELVSVANGRDMDGRYLFAGYADGAQPFSADGNGQVSYHGSQDQRMVNIGEGQMVAMADPGFEVFQNLRNGNGDFSVQADAANSGTAVMAPGEVADRGAFDPQASYTLHLADRTPIDVTHLNFNDNGADDTLSYQLEINGVTVDTIGESDTRTLDDIATNISAQSTLTGVSASVSDGVLYLYNDAPGGGPIAVREHLTGATSDNDTVTGLFGANLNPAGGTSIDRELGVETDGYVVLDDSGAVAGGGAYSADGDIRFAGLRTSLSAGGENGDRFHFEPSGRQDLFATLDTLADSLAAFDGSERSRGALSNQLNQAIESLDRGLEGIDAVRTDVGARLATLDHREEANSALDLQLRTTLSGIEDADITELATQLSQQVLALQASQQSFVKIQGMTLFDLI